MEDQVFLYFLNWLEQNPAVLHSFNILLDKAISLMIKFYLICKLLDIFIMKYLRLCIVMRMNHESGRLVAHILLYDAD